MNEHPSFDEDDLGLGIISERVRVPAENECRLLLTVIWQAARDAKFSPEAREFFFSDRFKAFLEVLPIEEHHVLRHLRVAFPTLGLPEN